MPKSVLVTGGAGFIGSHLVDRLLAEGHQVTVIDNFNDFYHPRIKRHNIEPHLPNKRYHLLEGDIRDSGAVRRCFELNEIQEVIHLAAMAGVRPSVNNPALYQEVNLLGTMNILEACREYGVDRFILASSSSVYGNNSKVPFAEEDRVDKPISPYASTKKSCELMAYTYHHLYGIRVACLRFFTAYGPRQRPEMAIHKFTDHIYRGREIEIFGDGQSRRDYTYISDIIDGLMACLRSDFDYDIYNLGRSDTVTLIDLVHKIETVLNKKAKIKYRDAQPGDVRQTYADITKASLQFGFSPGVSIDEGLMLFTDWYLKQQEIK